jgi:hypothetical protein
MRGNSIWEEGIWLAESKTLLVVEHIPTVRHFYVSKKEKLKRKKKGEKLRRQQNTLHQLRKRRHIGPKCRESPPTKEKNKSFSLGCVGVGFGAPVIAMA